MKKKNREKAEAENEDDMFAFSDLTTLGRKCLVPTIKSMVLYSRVPNAVLKDQRISAFLPQLPPS